MGVEYSQFSIKPKEQIVPSLPIGKINNLDSRVKYLETHGSSPAGSNTQVQYNNSGAFGASSNLTFNPSTNKLSVPNIVTSQIIGVGTAPDGNPDATNFTFPNTGSRSLSIYSDGGANPSIKYFDPLDTVNGVMANGELVWVQNLGLSIAGSRNFTILPYGVDSGGWTFNIGKNNDNNLDGGKHTLTNAAVDASSPTSVAGTGTIDAFAGSDVLHPVGTGTLFLTEVHVGDIITSSYNGGTDITSAIVTEVTDDTHLTINIETDWDNEAFTIQKPAIKSETASTWFNFANQTPATAFKVLASGDIFHRSSNGTYEQTLKIGANVIPGHLGMELAGPGNSIQTAFVLKQTDGSVDNKNWYFLPTGDALYWGLVNDSWDNGSNYARITRSGSTVTEFDLMYGTGPAGTSAVAATRTGVGIFVNSPTARLHLIAGTATASTAPLKFTSGTKMTTPEAGAIEFDGTDFYLTI